MVLSGKTRFFYDGGFVNTLCDAYWLKDAIYHKYEFNRTKFYEEIKLCRKIKIGDKLLVHRGDAAKLLLPAKGGSLRNRFKEPEVGYGT